MKTLIFFKLLAARTINSMQNTKIILDANSERRNALFFLIQIRFDFYELTETIKNEI